MGKIRRDQDQAQAEHCAKVAGGLLPRDLAHEGKELHATLSVTRQRRKGSDAGKQVCPAAQAAIVLLCSKSTPKTVVNNLVKKSQDLTRWLGNRDCVAIMNLPAEAPGGMNAY
jgi:hypothetical protein